MFEKSLEDKLQNIFKLKRVDFRLPSESQEQNVLFVAIDQAPTRVKDGRQVAKVSGSIRAFGTHTDFPHGYFGRCIGDAGDDVIRGLYFTDIDESAGTYADLDVRSARFVFFYDSQYDPDQGTINEVNIDIEVSE